ncbi:MAG: N-acetylmuramoyl-L-alanine amidase [Lachnospiraceae bacterium]|nr:N-acetylmuramoyl-L-alanine amidase [Lachnospiraceae bacterium]
MMTGQIYRQIHERKDNKRKPVISEKIVKEQDAPSVMRPALTEDFLEINDFSRPGTELTKINNIFVHYTANPGTSAAQNRSYFANLALTQERSASAHLIIGYEGEIIQCIPFDEQAYAVMTRNEDSISIECCYVDADGSFTQETYDSLVHTLAWLTDQYDLSTQDIMRHYDCGGKKCPVYYVEHEDAWNRLLEDVEAYRQTCMKKH